MARWPQDVDDQVMQSFEPPRPQAVNRQAVVDRSLLFRTLAAILFMVLGLVGIFAGLTVAVGWAWALAATGLLIFVIGFRLGDR